ncbi:hypothetical protein ES703_49170 [subsurface metagenome]
MIYIVKHETQIDTEDQDQAKRTYVELWKAGVYDEDDLDVQEYHWAESP